MIKSNENPEFQLHKPGFKTEPFREQWVVMNAAKNFVQMDPTTKQPWWSYSLSEAKRMCIVLESEFENKGCFPVPYKQAIREMCRHYGVEIVGPITWENVTKALKDAFMKGEKM